MTADQPGNGAGDEEHGAHGKHGAEAVAETARQVYRDMADRSLTTLQFAPDGLVIDGRMTFKP